VAATRKLEKREFRLIAVAVVALGAYLALRGGAAKPESRPAAAAEAKPTLPRIDLARLETVAKETKAGERDIFTFGRTPAEELAARQPPTPEPTAMAEAPPTAPPTPTLPPLNLKYIGSLANANGLKVAVLLTDRNELLTGKVGEVVANRYRIDKIGFESVDLEDVTSGGTRRIALRGK
jgi:hypothetical protein